VKQNADGMMIKSDQFQISKQARAYSLMFLIENMLRVSMHNAMVRKRGLDYFSEGYFPEYECAEIRGPGKPICVVSHARDCKSSERLSDLWLGNDYPYLWYVDFRVLVSMLEQFGAEYFDDIFVNKKVKHDIIYRLKRMYPIRNAIAHCRYLSDVAISDIDSLHEFMSKYLESTYIEGFEDIVLNSLEGLLMKFKECGEEVRRAVVSGEVVGRPILRDFQSKFSALLSNEVSDMIISEFVRILDLLTQYNKLPRKPGRGKELWEFRESTKLDKLLDDFMHSLQVKI
jgi:hypothetical protein